MARRTLAVEDVMELLDDPDEPVIDGSDEEDILCDEGTHELI